MDLNKEVTWSTDAPPLKDSYITITMTHEQARVLAALTGSVIGRSEGARGATDVIYEALLGALKKIHGKPYINTTAWSKEFDFRFVTLQIGDL